MALSDGVSPIYNENEIQVHFFYSSLWNGHEALPVVSGPANSHCWAGVYLSAVTLLWLGEMALLPAVYEPRFEVVSPSPAVSSVGTPVVSVQDVLARFSHERVDGEPLTPDTVTFLPKEGSWVVRDAGRYVSVTYDVRTGEARERTF